MKGSEWGIGRHALLILGIGVYTGMPCMFFRSAEVAICTVAGLTVACATFGLKDEKTKREMPFSFGQFMGAVACALVAVGMIAFKDLEYKEIINLARGAMVYCLGYPIVTFIIECIVIDKREKKERGINNKGQE